MFIQNKKVLSVKMLLKDINSEIFEISILSYLVFYILDITQNRMISGYVNLNIILIIAIITGIILVLTTPISQDGRKKAITSDDYPLPIILGIIGGVVIYSSTSGVDLWLRLLLGIVGCIVILSFAILIIRDKE
jgi:hypothetical protein